MVVEHALLSVIAGRESEFLTAFGAARSIISATPGFRGLRLSRSIEQPNQFLLLVEWNQLTDHTVGFRGSARYQEWKALLHHFYDPFPDVSHFTEVTQQP